MTDGIYTCDAYDYVLLLSQQDGKTTRSQEDWFYWWLRDNGIEPNDTVSVTYNELQGMVYAEQLDWEHALTRWKKHTRIRRRGPHTVLKDYPVVESPPQVLLDRWDWLMEEIRGDERALGTPHGSYAGAEVSSCEIDEIQDFAEAQA